MSTMNWSVQTHGDPLGTIQRFIQTIWEQSDLDGMLVPINGSDDSLSRSRLINDPQKLKHVNPFKPLMTENAAKLVPDLLQSHPEGRLGALFRPCEMRALGEMIKHDSFSIDNFLTISIDCLGTYPVDEYKWRAARKGSTRNLTKQNLQFARQGGIAAYRFRSACQMCVSPEAQSADINIHVLGLPVRQQILVNAPDEKTSARLRLDMITDSAASKEFIEQHEHVLARMTERYQRTRERVTQSLGDRLPADIDAVVNQLESCGTCQNCMEACPICSVDFPYRDAENHYRREDIMNWLVSCAGCGMCEQACNKQLPLSAIFSYVREQLTQELSNTSSMVTDKNRLQ